MDGDSSVVPGITGEAELLVYLQTLDTRDLKIISVKANGQASVFTTGPKHSFKGTPLDITLPIELSR